LWEMQGTNDDHPRRTVTVPTTNGPVAVVDGHHAAPVLSADGGK
jgi:hypothetical protein